MKELRQPPKWALRFLHFYCGDRHLEEIEGDLFELYNEHLSEKGPRWANLHYWWLVIRNFRSYAFKRSKMKNSGLSTFFMFFRHNLKVSWRDLTKNRTTSLINVLGLSIGLAAFILIYRIVTYELSFNTHLPDRDRIYRIYTNFEGTGGDSFTNYGVPVPVAGYVKDHVKGIEVLSHFFTFDTHSKIPSGQGNFIQFKEDGAFLLADSSYFGIADQYKWLSGTADRSLSRPYQVVLTKKRAREYFPDLEVDQMIGQSIIYQDSLEALVSGVVQPADHNSDFDFTDIISYATIDVSWLKEDYGESPLGNTSSNSQLWIKLMNKASKGNLDLQLAVVSDSIQNQSKDNFWRRDFKSQSVDDLHFNPEIGIFDSAEASIQLSTLKTLGIVAILLLLIAIFNFINLETAQAHTKLKEVGIRKVIGSTRPLLLSRFIFNALIVTVTSIFIAVVLAFYGLSIFSEFVPKGMTLGLDQVHFWLFLVATALSVGLVAGLYPAAMIVAPPISSALKQGLNNRGKSQKSLLRKGLILCQFVFSQFLIMATIVVISQISFVLDQDLGFDQEGVLYLSTPWHAPDEKVALLKNEMAKIAAVEEISTHSGIPAYHGWTTRTLSHFKDSVEYKFRAHARTGDSKYLDVYGIDLLAGRMVLPREEGSEVMINETFREEMGYETNEEVLGARLGEHNIVVGVISDFHTQSLHYDIEPTLYQFSEAGYYLGMRINLQQDLSQTLSSIMEIGEEVFPNDILEIKFLDETIERLYDSESRTSKLASFATGVAIFISCLGLFGLISFTTVQRTKEIGIRKVLGATAVQIGNVISKEFVILIIISLVLSIPLAYYYAHQWLERFSYKIDNTWWIFVVGGLISVVVAFLSVAYKIWQASSANPVESLRYE